MPRMNRSRFLLSLLTCAVAVASFAVVAGRAEAEICNPRTYYRSSSATADTCEESYDDAIWSAVAALQAAYPSCEFLSVSVVGPVGQGWLDGTGPGYIPQCFTTLQVKYICQVCYAS